MGVDRLYSDSKSVLDIGALRLMPNTSYINLDIGVLAYVGCVSGAICARRVPRRFSKSRQRNAPKIDSY